MISSLFKKSNHIFSRIVLFAQDLPPSHFNSSDVANPQNTFVFTLPSCI